VIVYQLFHATADDDASLSLDDVRLNSISVPGMVYSPGVNITYALYVALPWMCAHLLVRSWDIVVSLYKPDHVVHPTRSTSVGSFVHIWTGYHACCTSPAAPTRASFPLSTPKQHMPNSTPPRATACPLSTPARQNEPLTTANTLCYRWVRSSHHAVAPLCKPFCHAISCLRAATLHSCTAAATLLHSQPPAAHRTRYAFTLHSAAFFSLPPLLKRTTYPYRTLTPRFLRPYRCALQPFAPVARRARRSPPRAPPLLARSPRWPHLPPPPNAYRVHTCCAGMYPFDAVPQCLATCGIPARARDVVTSCVMIFAEHLVAGVRRDAVYIISCGMACGASLAIRLSLCGSVYRGETTNYRL